DTTPNGYKISIMLEEVGLPYTAHHVDIGKGDQFKPEFLAISPNNKIPAIIDRDGPGGKPYAMMESGAILIYLAEKTGKLLPQETRARFDVLQWLFFQMAHIGPMLGQAHHFRLYAPEQIPYAVNRYTNEAKRLYGVLDKRLADRGYLAGEYSVADIAVWPWLRRPDRQGVEIADHPNVKRWFDAIAARPAVERGLNVLAEKARATPSFDPKAQEVLFGATQYQKH
ncbi:MAG TPA: glutathione binding-like protein, partial [Dongiaceae bacterium]|nr:glutathione binding-like protein [Dongiaceae bacterium]